MAEFLEVGGVLTVLEILGLKAAKEVLKVSFITLYFETDCQDRNSCPVYKEIIYRLVRLYRGCIEHVM